YANRERVPEADETLICDYGTLFGKIPVNDATFVVIATPGFEQDFAAVRGALGTSAPFIGLIGSSRKREALHATLAAEGHGADSISRITIPVGLPIGGETPEEIALSIVAQLIERRRRGSSMTPQLNKAGP
ncbi:dehydrogenase, partial [bacterium]|nr:dehydrogenase [bacterium]